MAQRQLRDMFRDLLAAADIRADVPADELAGYCVHALTAASELPDDAAVLRLVAVTLAGLRA